jgi:hypothetical protein
VRYSFSKMALADGGGKEQYAWPMERDLRV